MKMCKNVGHLYSATIPKDKLYSVKWNGRQNRIRNNKLYEQCIYIKLS